MPRIRDHSIPFTFGGAARLTAYGRKKARLINGRPHARPDEYEKPRPVRWLDRRVNLPDAIIGWSSCVFIVWALSGWMPS
jgi:hypothetical protein